LRRHRQEVAGVGAEAACAIDRVGGRLDDGDAVCRFDQDLLPARQAGEAVVANDERAARRRERRLDDLGTERRRAARAGYRRLLGDWT
jgi:hypothetical protein